MPTPLGILPTDYMIISIKRLDEIKISSVSADKLPQNWKAIPPSHSTRELGDRFMQDMKYLVLKVPSAIVQGEYNYLLNPLHPDISKIRILVKEPFDFDKGNFLW